MKYSRHGMKHVGLKTERGGTCESLSLGVNPNKGIDITTATGYTCAYMSGTHA